MKLEKLTFMKDNNCEVELSLDDARKMYHELKELFGAKEVLSPIAPSYPIPRDHITPPFNPLSPMWYSIHDSEKDLDEPSITKTSPPSNVNSNTVNPRTGIANKQI